MMLTDSQLSTTSPIYKTDLYSFVYINEDRKTRTIWEEKQPGFHHSPVFFFQGSR